MSLSTLNSGSARARCQNIKKEYDEIVYQYFETDDPPVFALRDKLLKLFRGAGILKKMVFNILNVAPNANNRYGNGVLPSHCHALVDLFLAGGTSLEEIGLPLAAQMPPEGEGMHAVTWKFIENLVIDAKGSLPSYSDASEIWVTNCTKTHSMQAIRICALEHHHDISTEHNTAIDKYVIDGKLNLGAIRKFRPELGEIIDKGMEFEVLQWPGEEMFPRAIEVLQEVGNLGNQAAQGETRWEVCLKMHRGAVTLANAFPKKDTDEIWIDCARGAKRGNPTFKSEVDDLAAFTRHFGGMDAERIMEINAFQRSIQNPKVVKGCILKAIATHSMGPDGQGANELRMDFLNVSVIAHNRNYLYAIQFTHTNIMRSRTNIQTILHAALGYCENLNQCDGDVHGAR